MAAMEVLERVGIAFHHDAALKLLADAGANVDNKTTVARLPEYLVRDALRKVPSQVVLDARNPKYNLKIGGGRTHFTNAFGADHAIDLETGERRAATLKDLEEFTLLSDYFSTVDYVKPNVIPQDVPRPILEQSMALAQFKCTEKHCSPVALTLQGWRDTIRMAMALAGGEEEFRRNPAIVDTGFNNVPPLKYSKEIVDLMLECARYRIAFDISSGALAGASGPATIAGLLVQAIAENMGALVLTELAGPGTPILWGSCATILDQKHGTASYGAPENGLLHVAFIQMARYYGIPYYGAAGVVDSKAPDGQAAFENTFNALVATLAGADVVHDGVYGILEAGITACYEQFVISHDICGAIKRIASGIKVDADTMAVEIIKAVGHQKNFLTELSAAKHTKRHLQAEHWQPLVVDRTTRAEWEQKGSKDIVKRAREKAKEILSTHKVQPLDKDVEAEMNMILREAAKRAA
jgi:trimethylamine--corrinoid protein Co-methyltransferase